MIRGHVSGSGTGRCLRRMTDCGVVLQGGTRNDMASLRKIVESIEIGWLPFNISTMVILELLHLHGGDLINLHRDRM